MDDTVHGILHVRILEWVAFPLLRDLPNPRIEPRSPHCRQIPYQLGHKGCKSRRLGQRELVSNKVKKYKGHVSMYLWGRCMADTWGEITKDSGGIL